jgi:hypothetical protein
MNWFTKTCLVSIVLLLAVIAFRPMIFPQGVEAAHRYKYVAIRTYNVIPQAELDKYATDGWELTGAYSMDILPMVQF